MSRAPGPGGQPAPLAAVVLAAGAGARMGRPKALIVWRGQTFVRRAIGLAEAAACDPIAAVEGAAPLPDDALGPAAKVVHDAWPLGQLSSLQRGLQALAIRAPGRGVLVLSVDRPHLRPATVVALATAFRSEPGAIWQPAHAGRRGHPIAYPGDLVAALLALPPGASPRDLLARPEIAARRRTLAVDDPAVLDNLDRPEDLARLAAYEV